MSFYPCTGYGKSLEFALLPEVIANSCSSFRDSYTSRRAAFCSNTPYISQKIKVHKHFSWQRPPYLTAQTSDWSRQNLEMEQVEYGKCTRPFLCVPVMQYIRCCGVEGVACETNSLYGISGPRWANRILWSRVHIILNFFSYLPIFYIFLLAHFLLAHFVDLGS